MSAARRAAARLQRYSHHLAQCAGCIRGRLNALLRRHLTHVFAERAQDLFVSIAFVVKEASKVLSMTFRTYNDGHTSNARMYKISYCPTYVMNSFV